MGTLTRVYVDPKKIVDLNVVDSLFIGAQRVKNTDWEACLASLPASRSILHYKDPETAIEANRTVAVCQADIVALRKERDVARAERDMLRARLAALPAPEANGQADIVALRKERDVARAERDMLRARLAAQEERVGDHDYNGPTENGKAVSDPVHERFHGAIGDVLAGKVMPAAREQMRKALDKAPAEQKRFPLNVLRFDRQEIGIKLP
jgi:hypothetical protein